MKARLITNNEIPWWYENLLCDGFPENERKPVENIQALNREGKYDIFVYEDEGEAVGYATIWKKEGRDTYLLDYLGVPTKLRNNGLGAEILKDIRDRVSEIELAKNPLGADGTPREICLILETETPEEGSEDAENEIRRRRRAFYERNGYIKIYEMGTCGVRFDTMSYETVPDDIEQVMKDHKEIYGPERYDVIVPLPAGEEPPLPFWMEDRSNIH